MSTVWAIGDIHGEIEKLETLLEALPRSADDTLIFLGDYIDRGPDSAAVVRRVLAEYDAAPVGKVVLLWGNHEDMAASHFGFPAPSQFHYDSHDWFRNGGIATVRSYGMKHTDLFTEPCPEPMERLFGLLQTFYRLPQCTSPELENCVWVHAGLLPHQQPETAPGSTLLWVRDEFLNAPDPSGRIVIHGHSPHREVRIHLGKVGIDTGAAYGGKLTALRLPDGFVVQTRGEGDIATYTQSWQ